jgi:hypothetical protein
MVVVKAQLAGGYGADKEKGVAGNFARELVFSFCASQHLAQIPDGRPTLSSPLA